MLQNEPLIATIGADTAEKCTIQNLQNVQNGWYSAEPPGDQKPRGEATHSLAVVVPAEIANVPGGQSSETSMTQLQQSSTFVQSPNLPSGAPEVH